MKMKRLALIVAFTAVVAVAQTPAAQKPSFEVASIKPTRLQGAGVQSACHGIDSKFVSKDLAATVPLGRCVITSGRLSHMIGVAYKITMDMLKGGPDWVANGNDRYDLEAKAEDPSKATEADLLVMLQRLLTDRFKLKFHRETEEVDGFELVVAKNGPKIKPSSPDEAERIARVMPNNQEIADARRSAAEGGKDGAPPLRVTLSVQKVSMARLADLLEFLEPGKHIADATNLKGFYDGRLVVEEGQAPNDPLQEQLGLKLEAQKIPIEMFVVDSAVKPDAN